MSGENFYKEWQKKYGQQVLRANDLMQAEKRRFMIVQKSKDGLYVLDAELKHELKREGVIPNVYVLPDKMGIYINMVSGNALDYEKHGDLAIKNRESGDQKMTFRGTKCFEANAFDVEFSGQPVDLLTRQQQIGSWYLIPCPKRKKVKKEGSEEEEETGEVIDDGTRYIYSANKDGFEKITHANAFSKAVNLKTDLMGMTANEGNVVTDGGNMVDVDPRVVNGEKYKTYVDGVEGADWTCSVTDSDVLLFRPNQTFNASSAILAKGGSELGSCYHGHHDFMLSDDVVRKVHVGHYTFYSKAVVKRPKNYVIVENIFVQGYRGGMGVEFHTAQSFAEQASQGALGRGKDLIAVAIPRGTCPKENVLDITGRFAPSIYDTFQDQSDRITEHYPNSSVVYNNLQMKSIDMYKQTPSDEYMTRVKRVNTVCWRGHEMKKMPDGSVKPTHLNTGHLGENIYPGLRKVLDGEMTFVKEMDWASKMDLV